VAVFGSRRAVGIAWVVLAECSCFLQTRSRVGQIPASELPPSGTDTGFEGNYDPQKWIAQVIRGEMKGVAFIFRTTMSAETDSRFAHTLTLPGFIYTAIAALECA
jgi:hypothetical protein